MKIFHFIELNRPESVREKLLLALISLIDYDYVVVFLHWVIWIVGWGLFWVDASLLMIFDERLDATARNMARILF